MSHEETNLLPHFTILLAVELQSRMKRRLLADGFMSAYPQYRVTATELWKETVPMEADEADKLATACVHRIYQTQWNEAKAALSFANAVLKYTKALEESRATLDSLVENARRAAESPLSVPTIAGILSPGSMIGLDRTSKPNIG